jgi:opacity protein-like surface antigen
MGKGLLTAALLALAAAAQAAQPVMVGKAAGNWNGRVMSGDRRYEVDVQLAKEDPKYHGFYQGTGPGHKGSGFSGEFYASAGDGACYKVFVRVPSTPKLEFDAVACPAGPATLTITSSMGRGRLVFSDDFTRCQLDLSGAIGNASGILYRMTRDKAVPKKAPRTDNNPPLPAPKFQLRKP